MEAHRDALNIISAQVRQFYHRQISFRIYHGSTNSTRPSMLQRGRVIDTSKLNNVLKIDIQKHVALVEPNVPMDRLVEATLHYGLVPPVVMEFPGITTGGGFAGTSGESSSFRHGFFDRTINSIEMVLPDGEVVTASSLEKPDLFYGAAASFGTLGVTTLLEVQLIVAKKYVELTYHPVMSMPEALQKFEEITRDLSNDYLDGIFFAENCGVVCSGRLTDQVGPRIQRFTRAVDPWFYLHAKDVIKGCGSKPTTELVPLVDYLFRYDRGGFWVGFYAFQYFCTPFNAITRWMLDKFMRTRVMYHALHKSGLSHQYIVQDVAVPYTAAEEFLHYLDQSFGHYPLWLCPLRQTGKIPGSPHGLLAEKASLNSPEMLLNFGVWGPGPKRRNDFVAANRKLEHKVRDLNGRKWLYAHAYYSEEEFWEIYDRKEHDALRAKYNATYLPTIYDKVKVDVDAEEQAIRDSWMIWLLATFWSIWPLSGLYGVYKVVIGGDYLFRS